MLFKSKTNQLHKNEENINQYLDKNHQINPHKEAMFITGIYGIFGLLWIALSDKILYIMVQNITIYRQIQTYKGWLYVLVTMILIYVLVEKRSVLFGKSIMKIKEAFEELQATYEELVATEQELLYQKDLTESIIREAPVVIGIWDEEGKIKSLNPFGESIFGYSQDELYDKKWWDLLNTEADENLMENIFKKVKNSKQFKNHELEFIASDQKRVDLLWNSSVLQHQEHCEPTEILSIGVDITNRKALEEELKNAAFYDSLTGLYKRTFLEVEVTRLIEEDVSFALIHLDFNNFKYINNTLGYSIGDEFLKYIADKLHNAVEKPHIVGRLISDEFAILLKEPTSKEHVEHLLGEIIHSLGKTWTSNHHKFFVSFSMGVSLYPQDGLDHTILFRNADLAMSKAKREGKGRLLFYVDEILESNAEHIEMTNHLQHAIEKEELVLYYQPQYNLNTGEISGLEVLIRWIHTKKGFISPAKFIPLAEETGQIYEIEKWVIKTALTQKEKFEKQGLINLEIAINLSSKTLMSNVNFQEVEAIISSFDIDHSKITIEITETAIISNVKFAIERLEQLKKLGLKIALDDFGTGYSSLVYLNVLPIDIVKLDRSFVKSIKENSKESFIIKSILYLAKDLNYKVVAEGIETEEQLAFLKEHSCESGQGYLMSRPIPIHEIQEKLK
ncbi:diguanylate cyclase/phosphodiesterase with PAS/PAC sensor(s) [Alkaliphilus metalliredigens QYMF]|uniref:Diguanylate cyclase/phosphodiesterase with PAS/PAC sensor(S) n=1 Tax=Alkaliphilus metalliredigens (strain QYMF) TaxID=293826 RepID=A6TSA7_ALKMQ|nr:EAL domain-containing protein [Alkaliphilus metalliredigens]ABR49075.1 diguanylate cyclase/phosphodiesterase with PAS/PAC sensor(s) [Alkaliphilus metalliredigens QYMF]